VSTGSGLTATAARMTLGHALARLREDAGMTRGQASAATGVREKVISEIELGYGNPEVWDISGLYSAYGLDDPPARAMLLGLAYRANDAEWWHSYRDVIPGWLGGYLGLEQSAALIRSYAPTAVPVLLQTPDYARAVIAAAGSTAPGHDAERRLELAMRRQEILDGPAPARLWVILDEAALRRPAGSTVVMRGQLRHLIGLAGRPHVTLGVLPFGLGAHAGSTGPGHFAVLRLPGRQVPDVAYAEYLAGGCCYRSARQLDYCRHVLNQLSLAASTAGPAASILTRILAET
jgi:Domain of unknown function (DUF5753)/Helix-turn-helix domain